MTFELALVLLICTSVIGACYVLIGIWLEWISGKYDKEDDDGPEIS